MGLIVGMIFRICIVINFILNFSCIHIHLKHKFVFIVVDGIYIFPHLRKWGKSCGKH
jgi:hypothetical protein